jgi:hypothetical protein
MRDPLPPPQWEDFAQRPPGGLARDEAQEFGAGATQL